MNLFHHQNLYGCTLKLFLLCGITDITSEFMTTSYFMYFFTYYFIFLRAMRIASVRKFEIATVRHEKDMEATGMNYRLT